MLRPPCGRLRISRPVDDGDERRHRETEHRRAEARRVYTFAGSLVACSTVLDDQPADAAAEPDRDLGHDDADHRRARGRAAAPARCTAPPQGSAASTASCATARRGCPSARATRGGRRLQPAQRAERDREERQERAEHGDRHPASATRTSRSRACRPSAATSGASAISGTVCEMHEVRHDRPLGDPEPGHQHGEHHADERRPIANPASATRNEYHDALEHHARRPSRRGPLHSGRSSRLNIVHTCGIDAVVGARQEPPCRARRRRAPGRPPCSPPRCRRPAPARRGT